MKPRVLIPKVHILLPSAHTRCVGWEGRSVGRSVGHSLTHSLTHPLTHLLTYTHTQIPLPPRMRQEILQELRTPDRLRKTLDVVDIVLGFLSSGGGKANQLLEGYVVHTLKMKRRSFSIKVVRNIGILCLNTTYSETELRITQAGVGSGPSRNTGTVLSCMLTTQYTIMLSPIPPLFPGTRVLHPWPCSLPLGGPLCTTCTTAHVPGTGTM